MTTQTDIAGVLERAGPKRVTLAEHHAAIKAQGVKREDVALKCPICGTVQSMRSLIRAGVNPEKVENYVGFSCEGRWTKAGPYKKGSSVRGCDWTLGGLFQLHKLEVETPDGKIHPTFELASPDEAAELARAG